jgi:alkanesulfonate monooxygenase SsuD/methylene tetrahydromethanopterin reductase-like flavin-dependent oxidoreductase (luciferase family)
MKFSFFIINQSPEGSDMKQVYDEGMEQIELGDQLGYEGMFMAEHAFYHHGKPSSHVQLGNIAARTKRIRLGTAVAVLPWHNPIETAQDYATVDLLSDGRLDFGVGRGLFKGEFDGYGVPWGEAQARFDESLDIILKAWTSNGDFSYDGKFFSYPELEFMPKPLQKPHPPLWQPALSPATLERCLSRNITPILGASLTPLDDLKVAFARLGDVMEKTGTTGMERVAHPFIYVSDTTEKARKEAREGMEWFLWDFAEMYDLPEGTEWPPTYAFFEGWADYIRSLNYDQIVEDDLVWFGSPEDIASKIRWLRDECNVSYCLMFMHFGGLEHEKVMRSMELFAKEVAPQFQ